MLNKIKFSSRNIWVDIKCIILYIWIKLWGSTEGFFFAFRCLGLCWLIHTSDTVTFFCVKWSFTYIIFIEMLIRYQRVQQSRYCKTCSEKFNHRLEERVSNGVLLCYERISQTAILLHIIHYSSLLVGCHYTIIKEIYLFRKHFLYDREHQLH